MAKRIYYTERNIGTVDGYESRNAGESTFASLLKNAGSCCAGSFKLSGFDLSAVASDLSVDVAAGSGIINGRYIQQTTTVRVTGLLPNSADNYIFAKYRTDDDGLVLDDDVEDVLSFVCRSEVNPSFENMLLLGRCTTNATQVQTAFTGMVGGSPCVFTYTGTGTAGRRIATTGRPKVLIIYADTETAIIAIVFGVMVQPYVFKIRKSSGVFEPVFTKDNVPLVDDSGFVVHSDNHGFNNSGIVYYCGIWM